MHALRPVVCPEVCWNEKRSLCEACAPDLQQEAAAIRAEVAVQQLRDKATKVDLTGDVDLAAEQVAACPHCPGDEVELREVWHVVRREVLSGVRHASRGVSQPAHAAVTVGMPPSLFR